MSKGNQHGPKNAAMSEITHQRSINNERHNQRVQSIKSARKKGKRKERRWWRKWWVRAMYNREKKVVGLFGFLINFVWRWRNWYRWRWRWRCWCRWRWRWEWRWWYQGDTNLARVPLRLWTIDFLSKKNYISHPGPIPFDTTLTT